LNAILENLSKLGIIPVITINDAEKAVPLAKALTKGGIPCAEITLRTSEGEEAIRKISKELPDMLVGAGTVLTIEQVDRAINAGAKFIVTPGLNSKVVEYCNKKNILVTPGCSTPSDIEKALELNLEVVKFFPAEQSGGIKYINAIAAPYKSVMFMPTGGINAINLNDYLASENVLCCGGSWMVKEELIDGSNFDEIARLTSEAIYSMLGFELAHIGINAKKQEESLEAAKLLELIFGFAVKNKNSSAFSDTYIEIIKEPFLGKNGHIAIYTNHIERAIAFIERKGYQINYETVKKDNEGKLLSIYIKDEILGFAIHLLQKKR